MRYGYALTALLLLSLPATSPGQSLRDQIVENHFAYIPSEGGRFKTLIALPGCSGISSGDPTAEQSNPQLSDGDLLFRRHYRDMAEKLKAEGFVVLLVNIHAAEGLLTACADPIGGERMAEYINEAIAWASELPYVDPDRLHIIGWSMGGRGILKWLDGPRSKSTGVRSAIAVYPQCRGRMTLTIPMPILMLLGGSDDIAIPSVCEELVDSAPIKQHITVEIYPGARHGFDVQGAPPILGSGNGKTVGYQKEAAVASWVAILQFLAVSDDR
jgi:dienelactone hydrolase